MSIDDSSSADDLLTTPAPPGPDDAVSPPTRRRRRRWPFRRSTADRYLAGVAGGEGRRLGVDPFYLRVALVGITLLFAREDGGGFLVPIFTYLAAWLFWPTDDSPALIRQLGHRAGQQEIAGALAVFALATLVIGRPSLLWAGLLLGAAIALLGNRPEPGTVPPATEVVPPPPTPQDRAVSWGRSLRGAVGPRELNRPVRAPRRPRRTPALWPLTFSLLVAYGFACVLIDRLVEPGLDPGIAVNGAILIIGGVILLSGWRGRALATSLLLIPLVPAWVAFSVADTPRFADVSPTPTPGEGYVAGAQINASKGYGELSLTLDAHDLPTSGEVTATLSVTAGQIDVWVPKEARLHIVGHLGLGELAVYREPYWYSAGDLLVDYGLDRTYRALGTECYETMDSEEGLRGVADWSGVAIPAGATGDDIADAIEAAGYPRPNRVADDYPDWTYQTNENGGLCLPVAAPTDPVLITIDATVGLGNLKVHRV